MERLLELIQGFSSITRGFSTFGGSESAYHADDLTIMKIGVVLPVENDVKPVGNPKSDYASRLDFQNPLADQMGTHWHRPLLRKHWQSTNTIQNPLAHQV
jgi:hypothetical protein